MGYADVIRICGKPEKDLGSGIYILVYKLSDGESVIVSCTDNQIAGVRYGFYPLKSEKRMTVLLGK